MIKIEKILVPTDFSECSMQALQYGLELAKTFQAELIIANVVQLPIYPVGGFGEDIIIDQGLTQEFRDAAHKSLAEIKEKEVSDDVACRTVMREGTPFQQIIEIARDENVDMIVIATHGHTGLKHILIGSTAERVVRKACCPVLTVRKGEREFVMP